jgi:hypothetical protein
MSWQDKDDPVRIGAGFMVAFLGLAFVAAAIGTPICWYHVYRTDMEVKMMEQGYEEHYDKNAPRGQSGKLWKKVRYGEAK